MENSRIKIAVLGTKDLASALNNQLGDEYEVEALNFELPQAAEGLPESIILIPAGAVIKGRDGRTWKNDNPQRIVDYLNAQGRDLVLDFEHATELKAPKGEPAPAAAWFNNFALDDKGAVTAAVNAWTGSGMSAVKNKEYRYISPTILFDKNTMQIVGIRSVGLTNTPNFYLPALNSQKKEKTMNWAQLLKLLGLPEDATVEMAMNAVQKLQGDLASAINREKTPDLQKFVPRADYDQLMTRATNAEAKLEEKAQADLETAINSEIDAALKAGKIAPASKDYYVAMCRMDGGLEKFKKFIETAPVIAKDSGLEGKDPEQGHAKAMNAEEQQIAAMFGNSADDLKKYAN